MIDYFNVKGKTWLVVGGHYRSWVNVFYYKELDVIERNLVFL